MQKRNYGAWLRRGIGLLLAIAVLWTVSAAASAKSARAALNALQREKIPLWLIQVERGIALSDDGLSFSAALALSQQPVLLSARQEITSAWSSELQYMPNSQYDTEDDEGTVLTAPKEIVEMAITDNGVPSRTLKPSDPEGYLICGKTYINNASSAPLELSQLSGDFAATLNSGGPQVLIIHTHGTEAYTMPQGQEYEPSDNHRTLDTACNMIRVGDEMAQVLSDAGISVLHDRSLYDYPSYSGSYNRSLASIESYLKKYPSISFVLDIHRDAVEDANGNEYKLLSAEEPRAAQMEFVLGSNGGGLQHDKWRENLKLACAVQETILAEYPTLMRPIVVRSSRYNQHMTTGSLLLEVGTAGNSLDEALVSARIFAEAFAKTIQK